MRRLITSPLALERTGAGGRAFLAVMALAGREALFRRPRRESAAQEPGLINPCSSSSLCRAKRIRAMSPWRCQRRKRPSTLCQAP